MTPSSVRRFVVRLLSLFRSGRAEAELAREIEAHLQLLEDQFVGSGMSRDEARYAARRAFGGVEQAKEHHRDARSFHWLAGWPMDLKLGVRLLARSPGLTVVAVAALAVAIGAGAAYLEFTRDLLNPRLPVADGDRIVSVRLWDTERQAPQPRVLSDFAVWRRNAHTVEHLGAFCWLERHLITGDGRTELVRGAEISASAFRLFPTPPLLGRTLTEDDERPSAPDVVVIGHDVWHARFDAEPHVVGRTVRMGSTVYTIVGVMPAGFGFPANQNLWAPLKLPAAGIVRGEGPDIQVFGRLQEGTRVEVARAELQGLLADAPPALRTEVFPYLGRLLDEASGIALVHAANLLFIMLLAICGANVATLVFARTATREAEISVRTALGASRGRITAQLFAEAFVLSLLAAVVGLGITGFTTEWGKRLYIEAVGPAPFWWDDRMSAETILYAFALAVFAALIVGVIPAIKATGAQLHARLREAGATGSSMKLGWLWTAVIVGQVALTMMFLAAVVSLGWTAFRGQYGLDVTYPREQLLTARLADNEGGAAAARSGRTWSERIVALTSRLKKEPGVLNATYATSLPGTTFEQFLIEFPPTKEGLAIAAQANARKQTDVLWCEESRVGVGFFETVGIPLVAGRFFTDAEILGGQHVAIVDETFVRLMLGGRNPIGQIVRQPAIEPGAAPGPWHEIVGVVKDVTIMPRKGTEDAVLYRPAGTDASPIRLFVQTQGPASPMADRLQAAALSEDPHARLLGTMSVDRVAASEALPIRIFLRIFAVVAAVALLLSAAGIYALISFTLARRTREIGIRAALGAAPRRIITGVFARTFTQIGLGVLAGALPGVVIVTAGAEDSGRLGLTGGIAIMLGIGGFVMAVAMLSCAGPLRRALHIDPIQALRADG